MAWAKPHFTKGEIDRAGEILLRPVPPYSEHDYRVVWEDNAERAQAVEVINNWRAVHSYPLQQSKMLLKRRAKKIQGNAVVAQRLKRLASITAKLKFALEAGKHPKLSQMQDIGGCRAVMESVDEVRRLHHVYRGASEKAPHRGAKHSKTDDYIAQPKASGYRGIHLIYRFRSTSPEHSCYNDQRIEIQLRSKKQHHWATAVEVYSTFSGEALKSNIGSDRWKQFFALVSSAIAISEGCPCVPNTPTSLEEIRPELIDLYRSLNVFHFFNGYSQGVKWASEHTDEDMTTAGFYLLTLDPDKLNVLITPFKKDQLERANERYGEIERQQPKWQTVLVSADSIAGLQAAYPNYFLDSTEFVKLVQTAIGVEPNEDAPGI